MANPLEQLKKANDDYHEAFNGIMMDEDLDINAKAKFGSFHNNIFQLMKEAADYIGPHYPEK